MVENAVPPKVSGNSFCEIQVTPVAGNTWATEVTLVFSKRTPSEVLTGIARSQSVVNETNAEVDSSRRRWSLSVERVFGKKLLAVFKPSCEV